MNTTVNVTHVLASTCYEATADVCRSTSCTLSEWRFDEQRFQPAYFHCIPFRIPHLYSRISVARRSKFKLHYFDILMQCYIQVVRILHATVLIKGRSTLYKYVSCSLLYSYRLFMRCLYIFFYFSLWFLLLIHTSGSKHSNQLAEFVSKCGKCWLITEACRSVIWLIRLLEQQSPVPSSPGLDQNQLAEEGTGENTTWSHFILLVPWSPSGVHVSHK